MGDGEAVDISIFQSPQSLIRIHPSHLRGMSFASGVLWSCSCGRQTMQAQVLPDPTVPERTMLLSTQLANQVLLGLSPTWIRAKVSKQGVAIGPTIGILCNPKWNQKRGTLSNSKQLPVLEKLSEVGRQEGALVYVFGIRDVDFTRARVRGYVFVDDNWHRGNFPLPDAIYDQVISRKVESSKEYQKDRERLSRLYGARIFNDGFFDKWQVHEWLMTDAKTKSHVPHTIRYTSLKAASHFLYGHAVTFLKPIHGSLGLGIVRVIRNADGSVTYETKVKGQRQATKASSVDTALETLRKRLNSRPYLMQEGITLASYQERPFDVRIVLQRDGTGEWKRTKMFARVAKLGDFTSNISSGGEALPVSKVLEGVFTSSSKRKQSLTAIRRVSMSVTGVLETQAKKPFGELGIDVGIDTEGNVWIIEVNSKPWKSPTTERGRKDLVDLAFTRPIQYAVRLAQQS